MSLSEDIKLFKIHIRVLNLQSVFKYYNAHCRENDVMDVKYSLNFNY